MRLVEEDLCQESITDPYPLGIRRERLIPSVEYSAHTSGLTRNHQGRSALVLFVLDIGLESGSLFFR